MESMTFKYFKYEIALGTTVPMPQPKIEVFPHDQFSVQQYLHTLCKAHVGSFGKRNGEWDFADDVRGDVKLYTRPDIIQILDFSEKLGIIEQAPAEGAAGGGDFVPYKLSKAYWTRFDSHASSQSKEADNSHVKE